MKCWLNLRSQSAQNEAKFPNDHLPPRMRADGSKARSWASTTSPPIVREKATPSDTSPLVMRLDESTTSMTPTKPPRPGLQHAGFESEEFSVARRRGPPFELFGTNAGWSSDDTYPRELADVNGDGMADIVGFGAAGVHVSLATGDGHFAAPTFELAAFGPGAGGWSSDNLYTRELTDVNGDGTADIVGFGQAGVYVSQAHDFLLI